MGLPAQGEGDRGREEGVRGRNAGTCAGEQEDVRLGREGGDPRDEMGRGLSNERRRQEEGGMDNANDQRREEAGESRARWAGKRVG